jgi:hypothetical protein
MAVELLRTYQAQCDRCKIPHDSHDVHYTRADAYAAAADDGWLRQGDDAIYCAACVALAGAA